MISAFGVEHIAKAARGTEGDKRNTKYYLAATAGGTAGGLAGQRLGARSAYTTPTAVTEGATERLLAAGDPYAGPVGAAHRRRPQGRIGQSGDMARNLTRNSLRAVKATPGGTRTLRGGVAGGTIGATAATAAYSRHRRNRNSNPNSYSGSQA